MCAFDRAVDVVMRDVDDATIFRARSGAFLVFLFAMEGQPDAAIGLAVTEQRDLFRISARNAEWFEQKDQFVETVTVDERVEVAFLVWVVDVSERAQLAVVVQALAQDFLVIAIHVASLIGSRTAGLHRGVGRGFDFVEGFVSEPQYETAELFDDAVLFGKDPDAVFLGLSRRRQRHLAGADKDSAGVSVFAEGGGVGTTPRLPKKTARVICFPPERGNKYRRSLA